MAHHSQGVASHDTQIGGDPTTFVIDLLGQTAWALTGQCRQVWIECGEPSLKGTARRRASGPDGGDRERSRALACLLEAGLLVQHEPDSHSTIDDADDLRNREVGLRVVGEPDWSKRRKATWSSVVPAATVVSTTWRGCRLITDVESMRSVLQRLRGAPGLISGSASPLVEIRKAPGHGGGALIRLNRQRTWWSSECRAPESVGVILANLVADAEGLGQPLGDISWFGDRGRCLLHVGGLSRPGPEGDATSRQHRHRFGARVRSGRTLLLPDTERMATWLLDGADSDRVAELWDSVALSGVLVEGSTDPLGGWLQALVELRPWQPMVAAAFLSELLADGTVPLTVLDADQQASAVAEARLGKEQPVGSQRAVRLAGVGSNKGHGDAASPNAALQSATWSWATSLGKASWAEESAKIGNQRLVLSRGLIRVRLPRRGEGDEVGPAAELVDSVAAAVSGLGLGIEMAREVAFASVAAGQLYVGAELSEGRARRKLYVHGVSGALWEELCRRWPADLADGAIPAWIAWKWWEGAPEVVERSVYRSHIGGAPTVGHPVDSVLAGMSSDWVEFVCHLLERLGVDRHSVPSERDLLTFDSDGRYSVDISGSGPEWRRFNCMEPEARWLAAVASLNGVVTEELVKWCRDARLARLVLGLDGQGEPFVNLYLARF